jgi:myo-inositol-1(or 4)-monophosphatase
VNIYIGDAKGVSDTAQLAEHDIGIVINCAINLDIDWVTMPEPGIAAHHLSHGSGPVRYYKLGLVDGDGNAPEMLHAGYQLMRSALLQQIPNKASYRNRKRATFSLTAVADVAVRWRWWHYLCTWNVRNVSRPSTTLSP